MEAVFPNGAPETINSMYPDDNVGDGEDCGHTTYHFDADGSVLGDNHGDILLSVDLSLKSCAFWPKSHIGVCIGIM